VRSARFVVGLTIEIVQQSVVRALSMFYQSFIGAHGHRGERVLRQIDNFERAG
jgi:hypothetical protein